MKISFEGRTRKISNKTEWRFLGHVTDFHPVVYPTTSCAIGKSRSGNKSDSSF